MQREIHSNSPPAEGTARRRRGAVWLATGLGVGYLPLMPGTYGSALGVALYLGLAAGSLRFSPPQLFLGLAVLALAAVSIAVISVALRSFSSEDPQPIVLDEVAGQVLALSPLPLFHPGDFSYWVAVMAGFALFRALDAIKPYPIWRLAQLPGAWGVVADDLGAGAVAAAVLAFAVGLF